MSSENHKKRKHNKSGKEEISVSDWSEDQYKMYRKVLDDMPKVCVPALSPSPCTLLGVQKSGKVKPLKDGRISHQQVKVAYGYQVIAYGKFGKEKMKEIPASKKRDDLVLSHLCGTRNCCNSSHILPEPKWLNDERTHCHFVLQNYLNKTGKRISDELLEQLCPHSPKCGSELSE